MNIFYISRIQSLILVDHQRTAQEATAATMLIHREEKKY